MQIPEETLQLTLRQLLGLHVPRRRPGAASMRQLRLALRRMGQQLRANDAALEAEPRLARRFDALPDSPAGTASRRY